MGAGLLLVWLTLLGGRGLPKEVTAVIQPILAEDLSQRRADSAPPAPQAGLTLRQDFVPRWDGLSEIELLLVRHGEATEGEDGRFHIQLFDDADTLIAEQELTTSTLTHNQTYKLRFTPQPHSAQRRYTLVFSGSGDNPVSVWGYSLDVHAGGALRVDGGPLATAVPATNAQDLYFVARYQLSWTSAGQSLGAMLAQDGPIMLLALIFLLMPGALALLLAEKYSKMPVLANPFVWLGTALAVGTAVWPLLWLGLTTLGGRWRSWSLWLVFGLGWLAVLVLWRKRGAAALPRRSATPLLRHLVAPLILLIFATRLLAVRDLAFPPWVDASRHGLITAVMTHSGQMPGSYEPFLPVEDAPYHYGFHAISASLLFMTGWSLPRLLLFVGQLINSLIPLTVYTAVILITRRERAGLLAAFLVGLPFFFPGYYVTWGRLTQLTAMFIMPVLLAFIWLLVRGGRGWRVAWPVVGILAAGLFLIHVRVFLFFLPYAAIVWLASWGRNGRWLAAAAGLALFLVSPRFLQLMAAAEPANINQNPINNYNAFPVRYVQTGWEPAFLWLAAAALPFLLIAGLRRRAWSWLPLLLVGWTAVLFILLNSKRLGLPSITGLANLNSMYITLFLPLALVLAVAADRFLRWQRRDWVWESMGNVVLGGALMAAGLFGVRQQVTILNLQTILARTDDVAGLDWVNERLPETAVIAVSGWKWLGETWAASDGGAWLLPLTGRAVTTPPIDHIYDQDSYFFTRDFNETAEVVTDWSDPVQADWLRTQGVTHIFVGARGGYFDPAQLSRNPQMEMVYGRNGVFIFKLN